MSSATASRVLSRSAPVSAPITARVESAARELRYVRRRAHAAEPVCELLIGQVGAVGSPTEPAQEAASFQGNRLQSATWQKADKAAVDKLIAESRQAADHFRVAARAKDVATERLELDAAMKHLGDDQVDATRRSLGLTTQQSAPSHPPLGRPVGQDRLTVRRCPVSGRVSRRPWR